MRLLRYIRTLQYLMLLLFVSCDRKPIDKDRAMEIARNRFNQVCINSRLDFASFYPPESYAVGRVPFAFIWNNRDPRNCILITVDSGGVTNVSFPNMNPWDSHKHPRP
jgi:hypothetical protein